MISIFRKNIGRALLNKNNDPFLKEWEIDLTSKNARIKNAGLIDREKYLEVEKDVTQYIQDNFWFIVFPVEDKQQRLHLESRIIATVSLCSECHQSDTWLGNYSPKEKIRRSGLWQVNKLWKAPLSEREMKELKELMKPVFPDPPSTLKPEMNASILEAFDTFNALNITERLSENNLN